MSWPILWLIVEEVESASALVEVLAEGYFVDQVTSTYVVNIELLANAAEAGAPGVVLSGPDAQIGRLRADLYEWEVLINVPRRPVKLTLGPHMLASRSALTNEFLGAKVGPGPILDFVDWDYEWLMSGVGQWNATIPALDPALEAALNGTAKVIKFYVEGVGPVLTGWIIEHEIDESGICHLRGCDLSIILTRRSSFYRHNIERAWGPQMYDWAAAHVVPATFQLDFGPNSGGDPGPGDDASTPDNYFQNKKFQNQTIVEMWQELGQIWGNHWRINPVDPRIYIDQMGDDSGKIMSSIREDDPLAIEQGVFAITNLVTGQSDDEIVNCLLPQGSNNSFGVAVELRHSSLQRKFGYYSNVPWSDVTFPLNGREDEIRGIDVLSGDTTGVNFELGVGLGTGGVFYKAYAVPVTFLGDFHLAWIAAFGYRQNYGGQEWPIDLRLDLCPDVGGEPDTDNPVYSAVPGNYPSTVNIPAVNDSLDDTPNAVGGFFYPGGDKIHFSEPIWIPNQVTGYITVPAGSYWVVISLATRPSASGPWAPTVFGSGATTWVAGGTSRGSGLWYRADTNVWEPQNNFGPMVEISGRYNNAIDQARYPYLIECQYAPAIDDTLPTSGQRVFFIRDNDSIQEWGLRERVVNFQTAVDSRLGLRDIEPAANTLFASSVTFLGRHLGRFQSLSFEATGFFDLPKPGQKVRVVFRGMAEGENGTYKWVDIDDLYWVLGITTTLNDGGISHSFKVASVSEDLLDPNAIPYELTRSVGRHSNYFSELEFGTAAAIVRES